MDGRIEGWRTPSSSWAGHSRAGVRVLASLAVVAWWGRGKRRNRSGGTRVSALWWASRWRLAVVVVLPCWCAGVGVACDGG